MASGDVVGIIYDIRPPNDDPATPDIRQGGTTTTPGEENVQVWDFDAGATEEGLDFYGVLKGYGGGGLTVELKWTASSGTSSNTRWTGAFRRMNDGSENITSSHTYSYQGVSSAAPGTAGIIKYANITFTDGSQMDSLANNEGFIFRVVRDTSHADDGMTGDAELWNIVIRET